MANPDSTRDPIDSTLLSAGQVAPEDDLDAVGFFQLGDLGAEADGDKAREQNESGAKQPEQQEAHTTAIHAEIWRLVNEIDIKSREPQPPTVESKHFTEEDAPLIAAKVEGFDILPEADFLHRKEGTPAAAMRFAGGATVLASTVPGDICLVLYNDALFAEYELIKRELE